MLYNVPWEIHVKQEMTRIHGLVPILSGLRGCVEFNILQPDWELFNVHLVINVVIKSFITMWDSREIDLRKLR